MIEFLYRFRPLSRLIDKGELENQEIYFADPQQLNDPMEGFRDIFWRGDSIVWANLFRHYLVCLDNAYCQLIICGEEIEIGWKHIPLLSHHNMNDGVPHKKIEQEIISSFLNDQHIGQLINLLASRKLPIRRNELSAHLKSIHLFAIQVIREAYFRRELHPKLAGDADKLPDARKGVSLAVEAMRHFIDFEERHSATEQQADEFYHSHNRMLSEMEFINIYNGDIDISNTNRNFVFFAFPNEYPRKIECLIYPEWYAACFMRESNNSSIWGTYGDNHTAVCLKYRTRYSDGRPGLDLKRQHGLGPGGPVVNFVRHTFREVEYDRAYEAIDFFNSIGRFPTKVLRDHWYSDESGNKSLCGDEIFTSEDAWRKRYWEMFDHSITRKLKDWSHEKELRLTLENSFMDFSDSKDRTTNYKFSDLDGIIFGINTPIKSKIDICRIIERKCRKEGRIDFHFYQAQYQPSTGTIEHHAMPLLKFAT